MKKLLLLLFVFSTSFIIAQKIGSPDKAVILKVLQEQQVAWNDGRIEDFMKGYWQSDSLVFIGKRGVTKG